MEKQEEQELTRLQGQIGPLCSDLPSVYIQDLSIVIDGDLLPSSLIRQDALS